MNNRDILDKFLEFYNSKNIDELVNLYTEDATNYQIANEPVVGKEQIRKMFTDQFSKVKTHCEPVKIIEQDNYAVMEWRDPKNFQGCSIFEFKNGKIYQQRGYWDKLSFFKLHEIPFPLN